MAKITAIIDDVRNKYDADLVFEALMAASFEYRGFMIANHYEEKTVRLKEEIAKKSADEMDPAKREEIRKNDRGGEYSTSHELK
jgi:hypothetical protein